MTAAELTQVLQSRGVSLFVEGGELTYRAPRGVLTDLDRTALKEHRDEVIEMLLDEPLAPDPPASEPAAQTDPGPPEGRVGEHRAPCGTCGNSWFWPSLFSETGERDWRCASCFVSGAKPIRIAPNDGRESMVVGPDEGSLAPEWVAEVQWLIERDLDPTSIHAALAAYLAAEWGGAIPDVSEGTLLARFNTWLEHQSRRPTTLPLMRLALGVQEPFDPLRAVIARCSRCGGTDWGDSNKREANGVEVWCCLTCNPQSALREPEQRRTEPEANRSGQCN